MLQTDDAGVFSQTIPLALDAKGSLGSYRLIATIPPHKDEVSQTFRVEVATANLLRPPSVRWMSPNASFFEPDDVMIIAYRVEAGNSVDKKYDLYLWLTSDATGKNYFFYDDARDDNRWIHTAQRHFWQGAPTSGDFRIPSDGQPPIVIETDTPSGRYKVRMAFTEVGSNQIVGDYASSAFVLSTPTAEGACFIATAAFGSPMQPAVSTLRRFRDEILSRMTSGRAFIRTYYKLSPDIAEYMTARPWLRKGARVALYPIIAVAAVSLWVHPIAGILLGLSFITGLGWLALRGPRMARWIAGSALLAAVLLA